MGQMSIPVKIGSDSQNPNPFLYLLSVACCLAVLFPAVCWSDPAVSNLTGRWCDLHSWPAFTGATARSLLQLGS